MSNEIVDWLAQHVSVAGLLLFVFACLPKNLLLRAGRYVSPNQISVAHTPFALVGYFALYLQGHLFWGLQLIIFGAALDRLDGRLARLLKDPLKRDSPLVDFWTQMKHKGGTTLGEVLDPLMDKLASIPIYTDIYWRFIKALSTDNNALSWALVAGLVLMGWMLIFDAVGQLVRSRAFDKYRRQTAANWVGKTKSVGQWVWLLFFVPWHQGWVAGHEVAYVICLDVGLLVVLVLTIWSVVSKLWLTQLWQNLFLPPC